MQVVKKVAIVILAFLYLGLTTGVVKNLHYCMGELSNVDYGYDSHDACDNCGMQEKDGCCNTELKVVKLDDSHQWSQLGFDKKQVILSIIEDRPLVFLITRDYPLSLRRFQESPPDPRTNSLYLHTSVFLI